MSPGRMAWLDVTKGWACLWIVYFHSFTCWIKPPSPIAEGFFVKVARPESWHGPLAMVEGLGRVVGIGLSQLSFHAVGLFLIASGFILTQAAYRNAAAGETSWGSWAFRRLMRLYPMYWLAHLVYLVIPFQAKMEPLDWRVWVSLSGFRFLWIDWNFFYLNAAWWFFCLIIQLFALFPLLFWALRKWGPTPFFFAAVLVGFTARYVMLYVHPVSGQYVLGGCGLSRMPEFALGMVLGALHARNAHKFESWLLRGPGFWAGFFLYPLALAVYRLPKGYVAADLLNSAACFLVVAGSAGFWMKCPGIGRWLAVAGTYSYGTYLIHQPFAIHWASFLQGQPAWQAVPQLFLIAFGLAVVGTTLERYLGRWLTQSVAPKPTRP